MAKVVAKKKVSSKATSEINSTQAKVTGMQNGYKTSKEYLAAQKLQGMSIQDIAKKYGFDFSKGYANRQAETAAQAQRNVYNGQRRTNDSNNISALQRIKDSYDSSASSLDKGYFQQFLGTRQGQADRGLNAGIAANQNLQLAMNKQGEVADLWKQRNANTQDESMRYLNENQTITEALAQVEKEKAANAENLYQNLLSKGYDILSSDRSSANQWADSAWNRVQSQIGTTMDFSKMRVSDIYDQMDRAERAAAAAAAQAAARRSSGGGGGGGRGRGGSGGSGGYSGTPAKTSLTPSYNGYNDQIKKQQQTPIQRFVGASNTMENWRRNNLSPTVSRMVGANSHSPANTPSLSAWDKMKMLGL